MLPSDLYSPSIKPLQDVIKLNNNRLSENENPSIGCSKNFKTSIHPAPCQSTIAQNPLVLNENTTDSHQSAPCKLSICDRQCLTNVQQISKFGQQCLHELEKCGQQYLIHEKELSICNQLSQKHKYECDRHYQQCITLVHENDNFSNKGARAGSNDDCCNIQDGFGDKCSSSSNGGDDKCSSSSNGGDDSNRNSNCSHTSTDRNDIIFCFCRVKLRVEYCLCKARYIVIFVLTS